MKIEKKCLMRLSDLLLQHQLTQAGLAGKVEITQPQVSQLLRGTLQPKLPLLIRLARIFGVTLDGLLAGPILRMLRRGVEKKTAGPSGEPEG